jgi:ribosome maturation factor RimP
MISKQKIEELLNDIFEGSDKFLVDLKVSTSNVIRVFVDGDNGVSIDNCAEISKQLEEKLDRETEDFELQVSSAGIDAPLKNIRQFIRNIGRKLDIQVNNGNNYTGILLEAKENTIVLENNSMQKRPDEKKKVQVTEQVKIQLEEIKSAKIIISF